MQVDFDFFIEIHIDTDRGNVAVYILMTELSLDFGNKILHVVTSTTEFLRLSKQGRNFVTSGVASCSTPWFRSSQK